MNRMMILMLSFLSLSNCLTTDGNESAARPPVDSPTPAPSAIMPDPAMQALLHEVVAAKRPGDRLRAAGSMYDFVEDHRKDLEGEALVLQVLYHAAMAPSPDEDRILSMMELLQFSTLMSLSVNTTGIVRAVAPHVRSNDDRVKTAAMLILFHTRAFVPTTEHGQHPDFPDLRYYFTHAPADVRSDPPGELFQQMYRTHPLAAFVTLLRAQNGGIRDEQTLEFAEGAHQLAHHWRKMPEPERKRLLTQFAQDRRAWVRAYVPYTMNSIMELHDKALLAKMSNDPNWVVRECAGRVISQMEEETEHKAARAEKKRSRETEDTKSRESHPAATGTR
jgi:hypothetical protein